MKFARQYDSGSTVEVVERDRSRRALMYQLLQRFKSFIAPLVLLVLSETMSQKPVHTFALSDKEFLLDGKPFQNHTIDIKSSRY